MTAMPSQEVDRIRQLRSEGLGYKRIARLLNRNVRTIKRRVSGSYRERDNEKLKHNRRLRDGFGNVIRTPWSDELVSLLKSLHEEGITYGVMKNRPEFLEAGLSICALKNKAHRLRLANRNDTTPWDSEKTELLKSLWDEGYCASLIAEKIGGISRSAVIAKAKRIGLPSRPSTIFRPPRPRMPRKRRTERKQSNRPDESSRIHRHEDIARVSLFDLRRDQCRWPVGYVGMEGFGFCGNGVHPGSPYCPGHTLRAYTTPPDKPKSLKQSVRTGGFA